MQGINSTSDCFYNSGITVSMVYIILAGNRPTARGEVKQRSIEKAYTYLFNHVYGFIIDKCLLFYDSRFKVRGSLFFTIYFNKIIRPYFELCRYVA